VSLAVIIELRTVTLEVAGLILATFDGRSVFKSYDLDSENSFAVVQHRCWQTFDPPKSLGLRGDWHLALASHRARLIVT